MQPLLVLRFLALLAVANGAPVIAKRLMGDWLAFPLDGGCSFLDGSPFFGRSKTVRGVVLSVAVTGACAPLVALAPWIGAVAGATAMAGDLFSSFIKRRLGLAPSSRASFLDQIPESLFPLLACRDALALTAADIVAGVAVFTVGEMLFSRVLYRWHLRDRPY